MTPQRLIARRALVNVEALNAADRADVYEAIAIIMKSVHPEESTEAQRIADTIREAESAQMKFHVILSATKEENS